MKTNRSWLFIAVVVLIIAALLFWNKSLRHPIAPTPMTQSVVQSSTASITGAIVITQNTSNLSSPTNSSPIAQDDRARLAELTPKAVENGNKRIDLYGKVIDQNSNPVPGVKISIVAQQWYMPLPGNFDSKPVHIGAETQADGRFEIHDKGNNFNIETVEKSGYELSSETVRAFRASNSSFENPVIFKMWKKGETAQLISQDNDTRIPYDGTPVVFDLLTGQKNTGDAATGDLRVTLTRNPLNIPSGYRNAFEWHATIEAIDGGLIQSDDEFMYVAPADGYQPRIQIDMPADATNWANIYDISFYAKTRGGNIYSRVKFEFRVDSSKPQTGFTITSSANPSGSRNLQP